MIGDVNLYFHTYLEKDEAEIEVMIAEKEARGKGFAQQALKIMMHYGFKYHNITKFIAKIKMKNVPSIKLFQDKLKFQKLKDLDFFEESHFILNYEELSNDL